MASETTTPAEDLPPGWVESSTEAHAQWTHDDHGAIVTVQGTANDSLVLVEQYVSDNGLTSRVLTHGDSFEDQELAVARALDIMTELGDGEHLVDCILAVEHEEAVDFIAVYPDQIPDEVDLEEITDVVTAHLGDGDPDTLDEDATEFTGDDLVTIDVFPRPDTHVVPTETVEVGDPTTISGDTAVDADDADIDADDADT